MAVSVHFGLSFTEKRYVRVMSISCCCAARCSKTPLYVCMRADVVFIGAHTERELSRQPKVERTEPQGSEK